MSDEAALLAAILAHPDEDTPRLMFADWLDEHGRHDRAEFIRIQCDSTADEAAEDRVAELEEQNRGRWLAGFGLPQFPGARWVFRRGFPEHLDARTTVFVERFYAFVRIPWLRFLSLRGLGSLDDFVNRSWNPHWVELELEGDSSIPVERVITSLRNRAMVTLARSSRLSQLSRLRVSQFELPPEVIHALATSPHLDNLEQLFLEGDRDDPRFAPLRERFGDRLVIG